METLFAWYNVIFIVPLLIACVLVVGAGFGVAGDFDADVDVDVDADADIDADIEESLFIKALSIFGVGKCPLSIVVLSALLIFGGAGIILNQIFAPLLAPISVGGAVVAMLVLTRLVAMIVSKLMPRTETYAINSAHIEGLTGKLILKTTTNFGEAHVRDHHGGLHKIKCRTYQGELAKGTPVLVVEKKDDGFFYVEKDPQTEEGK